MTLAEIRRRLRDRNLSKVAQEIGMHRQSLWRIATGVNDNPTTKTLEKITAYLQANP